MNKLPSLSANEPLTRKNTLGALQHFHYSLTGTPKGKKLVFLHGLMGSANNWRKIAQAFEDQFEVLCFDQRGHGRSFKPESGYTPHDFAGDLYDILGELGWQKIYLVGHSMGGRNAVDFAAHHSDFVEKLVVEDIGPDRNPEGVTRIKNYLQYIPTPFVGRNEAREFLNGPFVEKFGANKGARILSQYFYMNLEQKPNGQMDWRFSKSAIFEAMEKARERERWEDFHRLNCPTLIVRGENSLELKKEVFTKLLEENPQFHGIEIAEAGHWVHFDQPKAFIEALKAFFDN